LSEEEKKTIVLPSKANICSKALDLTIKAL